MLLVGVDGSPTSLQAAAYAAGLARRQQARLVAVYVAAPPSPLATQLPDAGAREIEGRAQLVNELGAETAAAAARIGIVIEYLVRRGDPSPSSPGRRRAARRRRHRRGVAAGGAPVPGLPGVPAGAPWPVAVVP